MSAVMTVPQETAHNSDQSNFEFIEPIAGFAGERTFSLTPIDDAGYFQSLRSVDAPELRFILTEPTNFFAAYAPAIDQRVLAVLGCSDPKDVVFYVILSVATSLVDATANLRAPIAMSVKTRRAAQIVLDDDALSFREPLAR